MKYGGVRKWCNDQRPNVSALRGNEIEELDGAYS
jgi:hypothetical protein